jgi:PAS domain S-box-containing protein
MDQQIWQSAMEQAPRSFVLTDLEFRIVWANAAFSKITGFSLDDIRGKKPKEFLQGPETSADTASLIRLALTKGIPFDGEILNYRKSGEPIWLHLQISPILDAFGNVVQYMGVHTDITDKRRAREQMKRSEKAFREAQRLAHMGSWELDTQSLVLDWTWEHYRIFGVDIETPREALMETFFRG